MLVATLAVIAIGRVPDLGRTFLALVLLANAAVLALRLFAIVDAGRGAFASRVAAALLAAVVVAAVVPHVAAAYVAVRGYGVLESVFADEEPTDVLGDSSLFLAFPPQGRPPLDLDPPALRERRSTAGAAPAPFRGVAKPLADSAKILADEEAALEHPWVTILLLGSDEGPRQAGDRTDTMIVAAIQRKTHRAVLFGVPRNLVGVDGFGEPLNALYQHRGATGLKHAISRLLGLRVDYHAMVNLNGFVSMVDALGGVRITVKERIVDEVTRPAWGETKPKIDVYPGRTYRFTGRTALAYVRSRQGVERLPPHGSPALLHQRAREPARRRRSPAPLRFAGGRGRVERAHGHPAEPCTRPDAPRSRRRPQRNADGDVSARRSSRAAGTTATRTRTSRRSRHQSATRSCIPSSRRRGVGIASTSQSC